MRLNDKTDLTRWNRAGLSEFRYIDGNAITYLETLRQQLVEEFDLQGTPSWQELVSRFPQLPNETRSQIRKRLKAQYYDERRDYAWEILRSFARSAHVLGEYTNAYANEVYLPTAVEWDNIRKLVAMLGYRPSPPASAETHIALLFKAGESGEVGKGFALKNKPADGESTVIFETQEKLTGSDRLNQLYLKDWDKNFSKFKVKQLLKGKYKRRIGEFPGPVRFRFPLAEMPEDVSVGDLGVLATSFKGLPVKVTKLAGETEKPYLELQSLSVDGPDKSFQYYNTSLYLQPGFVESPLANGNGSALLKEQAALAKNEIVFGKQEAVWQARQVLENELQHVQFDGSGTAPAVNEKLFRARSLKRQSQANLEGGSSVYLLPNDFTDDEKPFVNGSLQKLNASITKKVITDDGDIVDEGSVADSLVADRMYYIKNNYGNVIYYPAETYEGIIDKAPLSEVRFAGKAKDLETGGWVLVTHKDNSQAAYPISELNQDEEWFEVELTGASEAIALLRSAFKVALQPRDHDINRRLAWSLASSDAVTVVELVDAALADELKLGQKLICAGENFAAVVELKDILSSGSAAKLHLAPPFHQDEEAAGLTRHECILYANVARATHGETQPEKILGNGDASQTQQSYELPSEKISWVADAGFAPGVRADLTLRVGQRVWQQVENLAHSAAEDHHYQVKVNEDGLLLVCFGDGRNGRRLPTGVDNVRVRYRTGYGEEGNLDPHALLKIARPHRLVEDFVAPLATSGGAEKEASESMRESAPATVLALSRAVSLDDFTHLAAHHSMVWQARAFEKMPDRPARPLIEVVVVAAGGATFATGSETAVLIQNYLQQHSIPGTPVSVISYAPLLLDLKISIMVDEAAFDKKQVELAVREQLQTGLALKQRRLGQPLFRSEVIALLEEVEGVENGHCEILATPYAGMSVDSRPRLHKADDGGIRRVSVKPHQLLYLDADVHEPVVSTRQYEI
ncbi:MAG: hypothetical protein ABFS39_03790 [Pseudomonadota bacterium]